MRLINTSTREFHDFIGSNIPPYAILSHTWSEEEVTYKDYLTARCQTMKGYAKIDMTCRIAKEEGIAYTWVDTCCIDKSSSAELSEAINSMFRWYQRAEVCYAFLEDLADGKCWEDGLSACRWFTRGWTLQELIAPRHIRFYNEAWRMRPSSNTGSADTKVSMAHKLSAITNIDKKLLLGERPLESYCIAQKMSWAAHRTTTRMEDAAYCLLGIFDLNMPLLYGEEEKAFQRLQEEIIRSTADLSILAWKLPKNSCGEPDATFSDSANSRGSRGVCVAGVLANFPAEFASCKSYEGIAHDDIHDFSLSNIGIKTCMRMSSLPNESTAYILVLPIVCGAQGLQLGIRLRQVDLGQYVRSDPWELYVITNYRQPTRWYPAEERTLLTKLPRSRYYSTTRVMPLEEIFSRQRSTVLHVIPGPGMELRNPWPAERYDHEDEVFPFLGTTDRSYRIIDGSWHVRHEYGALKIDKHIYYTIIMIGVNVTRWFGDDSSFRYSINSTPGCIRHLKELKLEVQENGGDEEEFLISLHRGRVPRTLTLHSRLHPSINVFAILTIELRRYRSLPDSHIERFDLHLKGTICEMPEEPIVEELPWY